MSGTFEAVLAKGRRLVPAAAFFPVEDEPFGHTALPIEAPTLFSFRRVIMDDRVLN
jgi:hypothetical protein